MYVCPVCETEEYPMGNGCHCAVVPDDAPVTLLPCPFCGGPPAIYSGIKQMRPRWWLTWRTLVGRVLRGEGRLIILPNAHVFCHECGAQASEVDDFADTMSEARGMLAMLRMRAVLAWQTRNHRNRVLYVTNGEWGNNLYPREGESL